MENLPKYISIVFGFTTILTILIFYKASQNSKKTLVVLIAWLLFQAIIGQLEFYTVTNTTPPRFLLLLLPPILLITFLFFTSKGQHYIDGLSIKYLTILHLVRIPVEVVLFWLCVHKTVPQLMTFEGRNFDILSGLTAPIIFYFGFVKKKLSAKTILIWNFVCLGLLINIVANAILSAPFPFQKLAFEQPNIAVLYFPFNWLPAVVVPIVLFSHFVVIRQIVRSKNKD